MLVISITWLVLLINGILLGLAYEETERCRVTGFVWAGVCRSGTRLPLFTFMRAFQVEETENNCINSYFAFLLKFP